MRSWNAPSIPSVHGSGPTPSLHNTATGSRAPAPQSSDSGTATLYVCGITPYDATHLGHAATYVTFDILGRLWRDAGLAVTYVQNITDVDDPLLERAERDGVAWQDLAAREIDLFREDMEALRVVPPQHYIGAVEGIPDDVAAVERLRESGLAYHVPVEQCDGDTQDTEDSEDASPGTDVYLDLAQIPAFGAVSCWDRTAMLDVYADRGGDPDRKGKRDPLDPLLWRAHRTGEPSWDGGSLGSGRPGWHIECTTIALRYLGEGFDVQGGGSDLIFPHHEMSAAQGSALTGARFADAYVHQAMVALDGEKMSKSKGNLVLVSGLRADGVDPMAIRLLLLDHHYRTPWSYTPAALKDAQDRLTRWRSTLLPEPSDHTGSVVALQPTERAAAVIDALRSALADDLDTPAALATIDRAVAALVTGEVEWSAADRRALAGAIDALLGIRLTG